MLVQASQGRSGSAHVVVLGNEKGGSGKSTSALHIAVALLKAGQRVATIDLDCRQQSFTRYINNRSAWARRTGINLELPVHCCIRLGETMQIADNENSEFQQFVEAVSAVERTFDFIVIDTPGTDSYLMRLAHSMADTLVTPINDSFLDFDVLGQVDPATYAVTGASHYAEMVRDTRRKRRQRRRSRFDDGPQFKQAADELHVGFAGEGPGENIGIKQIPARARQDLGSRLGPAFNQPLGCQHLHRFAIGATRHVQFFGKGNFARKRCPRRVLARHDRDTQLLRDCAMQPSARSACLSPRLALLGQIRSACHAGTPAVSRVPTSTI